MAYLSFIDDQLIEKIIFSIIEKTKTSYHQNSQEIHKNVIDPFSIFFEIACFDMDVEQWKKQEKTRQVQKTLSNQIGMFHQNILGSLKGWESVSGGMIDVLCKERRIIAEIKNKHNTTKGSDKSNFYYNLEDLVMRKGQIYKDYTAYYVEIIPKTPQRYNIPFRPSDSRKGSKCSENENIRQIDGYSFYHLATGIEDALLQLFLTIPKVMRKLNPQEKNLNIEQLIHFFNKAYL